MLMRLLFVALFLAASNYVAAQDIMLLKTSGKVVIGDTAQISTPGTYNLYVQNGILTEKVKVSVKSSDDWSDDAWDKTPTLEAVKNQIQTKKHLIDMPSAADVVAEGYEVSDMDAKLLQQIEWLWQHIIKLQEENKALKAALDEKQ